MADMIRPGEPVIDDSTPVKGVLLGAGICGTVPRDYSAMPVQRYGAVDMPVLSLAEIEDRAKAMADEKSRLSDYYLDAGWENLDQNGHGYCWQYGPTQALMMNRMMQNQPLVILSAHCPAAVSKNGKDEGAWGAMGMDNLMKMGAPEDRLWPRHSRSVSNFTEAVKANAQKYRITEGWFDAAAPVYDRDLSYQQVLTLLVCRIPVVFDFDWWGHCVCGVDVVVSSPGVLDVRILNSWKNWGQRGLAVLQGSKARPNNAVAPRVATAA